MKQNPCAEIQIPLEWILFKADGSFTEQPPPPPLAANSALDDYLYNRSIRVWYRVEIARGTNNLYWDSCDPEDVPSGLRLMVLLIT